MILKGRRKILSEYSPEDLRDVEVLKAAYNAAMVIHQVNKQEIDYLVDYKNGRQPVLDKEKEVRPEINNKLVINHAQMITRMVTGYFLGTPIQYTQATADKKSQIEILNRAVAYEDKPSVDKELAEIQSICGTAYRVIFTDGMYGDDVPFEDRMLNPATTFVVYQNNVAEIPLFGAHYFSMFNDQGYPIGSKIYIYTNYGSYVFTSTNPDGILSLGAEYEFEPYDVGGVPVVEYPNNIWRIGDWELCIDLMDAINGMQSGRLDDVDQTVQSLLVFINADIDSERYEEMRQSGVISLVNKTGANSQVQTVQNSLDQNGMNLLSQEFEELLYALIGIPDRNNRAGGGGDTGAAVELRDGWADLEIIARNKELTFRRSEKQALRIMMNILNNKMGFDLNLMDVNIKFSRNKNNNLLVKTQAYMNLMSTKTLDPADCLTIVDLVSDVNDFIERGKDFWEDEFAGKAPEQEEPPLLDENGQPMDDPTQTEDEEDKVDEESNDGEAADENVDDEQVDDEEPTDGDDENKKKNKK